MPSTSLLPLKLEHTVPLRLRSPCTRRRLSLAEALTPEAIAIYGQRSTGAKVLIDPSKSLPE